MAPIPPDATNPSSPSTFTLPFRFRNNDSAYSRGGDGGHHQTLVQQVSSLRIDDYQTPQGDRHVETRRHQTTTTTTTTASRTAVTMQPRDRLNPGSVSGSAARVPVTIPLTSDSKSNPSGSLDVHSSFSDLTSPRRHLGVPRSGSSESRSAYSMSGVPRSSDSVYRSPSETSVSETRAAYPSQRYLRTRRGAVSGPSSSFLVGQPNPDTPAAAFPDSRSSSSCPSLDDFVPKDRYHRDPVARKQLLLPAPSMAPGSRASDSGSAMSSDNIADSRTGSTITARLRLSPSKYRENSNHNRTGSQIITDPADYPLPSSSFSEASNNGSRSTQPFSRFLKNQAPLPPFPRTEEITPQDSISQIGIEPETSFAAKLKAAGRNRGLGLQRSSLGLHPRRNLPLRGVRHVPASEVGSLSSPPPSHGRPQQQEGGSWVIPSSTPGRFGGPSPPSRVGDGLSRVSTRRDYYQ